MIIFPTVLLGILLVVALSKGINEGLPTRKQPVCLRPMDVVYTLPRIVAPFFIVYPMIVMGHARCILIGILLYLLASGIKVLFWEMKYGINPFFKS